MATRRLDLKAIDAALRTLQEARGRGDGAPGAERDPLSDTVVENLLAGYGVIDAWVGAGLDIFAMGRLKHLLELNKVVLCGADGANGPESARHIDATEQRFYEEQEGGIEDVVEWLRRHAGESPWKRAAGTYVRILSKPQLFIEGNHRTGALIMSYLLLREGKPPFVLTPENAEGYFGPSASIRDIRKRSPAAVFRLPGITHRLAKFLHTQADPRYLLADAEAAQVRPAGLAR